MRSGRKTGRLAMVFLVMGMGAGCEPGTEIYTDGQSEEQEFTEDKADLVSGEWVSAMRGSGLRVSQPFANWNAGRKGFHLGLDMVSGNESVFAIAGGVVQSAKFTGANANGYCIAIAHKSPQGHTLYSVYPTPAGTRSGFITNVASLIVYAHAYQYQNGSTSEPVYDESQKTVIGSLDPREKATPLYRKNGMLHVVYDTKDHGPHSKSGYVNYNGGFTRF